jgi:hypothetical protein
MNTLHNKKEQVNTQEDSYRWGKIFDAKGPLLIPDGQLSQEIEQHHDPALDFVPVILLGHLTGTISILSELKFRVCPLFVGLDPPKGEVCCHNDSIEPLAVYQN